MENDPVAVGKPEGGEESPVHARAALVAREFGPMEGVLDLARAVEEV
jgi:hypothetical protein